MKRAVALLLGCGLALQATVALAALGTSDDVLTVLSKKVQWSLYGKVKMDVNYDTAQFVYYNDFLGSVANRYRKDGTGAVVPFDYQKESTNFNPRDTRFGFWAKITQDNWAVAGRVEMDFYGTNAGNNFIPRLRLGYVDAQYVPWGLSVLAGQDWIPVSQLNPSSVDFGILTAAGNLWWRVPQVTIRKSFPKNGQVLFSVMKQRRVDTARNDAMPWLLGRVAYVLGPSSPVTAHMAVGGGYRNADYGTAQFSDDLDRWLVAGELKVTYKSLLELKAEYWYGVGVGECFLRYDLDVNPKTGKAIQGQGGWVDLTWYVTSRLSVTGGYGIDQPDSGEMMDGRTPADLNDRQFTRNQQIYANAWFRIINPLRVGVEYIRVETERDTYTDTGDRVTASMEFVF